MLLNFATENMFYLLKILTESRHIAIVLNLTFSDAPKVLKNQLLVKYFIFNYNRAGKFLTAMM